MRLPYIRLLQGNKGSVSSVRAGIASVLCPRTGMKWNKIEHAEWINQ